MRRVIMKKVTVGRKRKKETEKEILKKRSGDFLMVLGTAAMCISIIIPLTGKDTEVSENAVAVMKSSEYEIKETDREELVMPDRDISANTADVSIFEYIGEFFAELIRGGIS